MIYLNNAATSYPKPECIHDALKQCIQDFSVGQFRGNHNDSRNSIKECKIKLAKVMGVKKINHIFFTSGATEAFNLVIRGLQLDGKHVIATATEHNAVLRPLYSGKDNIQMSIVPTDRYGYVDVKVIEDEIKQDTKAIFVNHCSNVTGAIQDIQSIGKIANKHNVLFIVDISQSAGSIPLDIERSHVDIAIFTGHKSLLGLPGIGGFYIKDLNILYPVKFGGTGENSHMVRMGAGNKEFEVGTQNIPGIVALNSSLEFLLNEGLTMIYDKKIKLINYMIKRLQHIPGIILHSNCTIPVGGLISFTMKHLHPSDIGYILNEAYNITVRTGFHCAPLIHQYINTHTHGTVRVSISYFTTYHELDALAQALEEISNQS